MTVIQKVAEWVGKIGQDRYDAKYDENGNERVDPRPRSLPIRLSRPLTIQEQIARMVKNEEYARYLRSQGVETFEEAEDFDVEDFDPESPYEVHFDPAQQKEDFKTARKFIEERPDSNKRPQEGEEPSEATHTAKKGSSRSKPAPSDFDDDDDVPPPKSSKRRWKFIDPDDE